MSDLLPIDATMIVGILIFYTIPTITKGEWLMNRFDKVVIYTVAGAVILFAISAIGTIIPVVDISEWCTVGGFIAIIIMVLAFTQVVNIAKISSLLTELPWGPSGGKKEQVEDATLQTQDNNMKEMAKEEELQNKKVYPAPWKDKTQDEMTDEEARRKQEEELRKKKARMEPSEGYHTMWPDQSREESSDKPHEDDAVGD